MCAKYVIGFIAFIIIKTYRGSVMRNVGGFQKSWSHMDGKVTIDLVTIKVSNCERQRRMRDIVLSNFAGLLLI